MNERRLASLGSQEIKSDIGKFSSACGIGAAPTAHANRPKLDKAECECAVTICYKFRVANFGSCAIFISLPGLDPRRNKSRFSSTGTSLKSSGGRMRKCIFLFFLPLSRAIS